MFGVRDNIIINFFLCVLLNKMWMDNRDKNVKDKYEYIFVCEFNGFVCY